ncbi:MAG: LD-carboxypeptidase [Lachnospiraceae bacterium]|nr:LD-carboxypeptidase [Lachnospiraceae bacterium]
MRYPVFLKEKGTIGFPAPSFGCATEPYKTAFENAQKKWKDMGYKVDLGPNCYLEKGIGISNTPMECGKELTEYYMSEDNDCLISCGGGELMCEILEYVDFEAIRKAEPKWFMGYSDNTNMTFLLNTLCDTAAIYGPCAAAFGMEPWHPSLMDAMELLCGKKKEAVSYGKWEREGIKNEEHPLEPYQCTEELELKIYQPDQTGNMRKQDSAVMEGRLIGGCMDCLVNLLGTRFDKVKEFTDKYKEDGIIWFLEACELNVFSVRRAMWQMEQAGWFQYVKGFLIGRPGYCYGQEMMGLDQYTAILPTAQKHGIPVIMDIDLGHLPPMMPLVSGSMAKVAAQDNRLEIKMEYR